MDTNLLNIIITMLSSKQQAASGNSLLIVQMILAALNPILAGVATYFASKAVKNTQESKQDIVVLKDHINSRMSELLKASGESQHAAGVEEGKNQPVIVPSEDISELKRLLIEAKAEISLLQKQPPKAAPVDQ